MDKKNLFKTNNGEVPAGGFPRDVVEQAQSIERISAASFIESRRDLRYRTVLSFASDAVSPVQYAFSLLKDGGKYRIGIHVADVSELVCPSTPLDDEARRRCASVDTERGLREMLPLNLVWETFNLKENEDRLTLSIILDIDANGDPVAMEIDESVTRVDRRCLFGELDALRISSDASAVMALRSKYSQFLPMIDEMYSLAALLFRRRYERGGMQIDRFSRIFLRDDNAEIVGLKRELEPDSKTMLNELLIFAAVEVGRKMREQRVPAIYCGQNPPSPEKIEKIARAVGISLDPQLSAVKQISYLVDMCRGAEFHGLVCDELRFELPCLGYSSHPIFDNISGADTVVQFANPATRYADLLAHRMLKHLLKKTEPDPQALSTQAEYYAELAEKAAQSLAEAESALDRSRCYAILKPGADTEGYLFDDCENTVILTDNTRAKLDAGDKKLEYGVKYAFRVVNPAPELTVAVI